MTGAMVYKEEWGPWFYSENTIRSNQVDYEIDLDECTTSAQVLDWICQAAKKEWVTATVLGQLVIAINDLLDPQTTLCPWGVESGDGTPIGARCF